MNVLTLTPLEQVALFLAIFFTLSCLLLWAIAKVIEGYEMWADRKNAWRAIDKRHAMERHPSSQAQHYDWAKEGDL